MRYIGGGPYHAEICPECGNRTMTTKERTRTPNNGACKKEENLMLNQAIMMGRLCADPELRKTQSEISVCSIRIAVDRDYGKGEQKETDFFDVVAWRGTAEFICKYFTKGRMIVVVGRMQAREWKDKEGNKRTAVELVADNAYFGDSKPNTSGDGTQAGDAYDYSNMDFEPNGEYQGSMPGGVSGDFAPDF